MDTSTTMWSQTPSKAHYMSAAVVSILVLVGSSCALPFGEVQWPSNSGFLPAFAGVVFVVELLTAVLLFNQAKVSNRQATALLASTYLFSSLAVIPHILAFPGVFAADGVIGHSSSAIWLWCSWHGGFATGIVLYATARSAENPAPVRIWPKAAFVASVVTGFTLLATIGLPYLPIILVGGNYARLTTTGIGPAMLSMTVIGFLLVVTRLRLRTSLALWLAVAMLAAVMDLVLSLSGGGRYTVGWYLARVLSLVTGITVLAALLSELTSLAARVAAGNVRLEAMLLNDALTGLTNRRGFDATFDLEWRRAIRERTTLSLLMVDIDFFKSYNDTYGHPSGDACIRRVGQMLQTQTRRPGDLCARVGGEEFAILLPLTDAAGALRLAQNIRCGVASLQIPHTLNRSGCVTVSVGIASTCAKLGDNPAMLINRADIALYAAKSDGRNTVVVADERRGVGLSLVQSA